MTNKNVYMRYKKRGDFFLFILIILIVFVVGKLSISQDLCKYDLVKGKVDSVVIREEGKFIDVVIFDSISNTRFQCNQVRKDIKITVGDRVMKKKDKNILFFYHNESEVPYYEYEEDCD